jgi:hypothetical protein
MCRPGVRTISRSGTTQLWHSGFDKVTLTRCFDWLFSHVTQTDCNARSLWCIAMTGYTDRLLWQVALTGCSDRLLWQVALTGCSDRLLWQVALTGCSDRLLWQVALTSTSYSKKYKGQFHKADSNYLLYFWSRNATGYQPWWPYHVDLIIVPVNALGEYNGMCSSALQIVTDFSC